jgi:DhnA family fructose-bisphosphate aldolase class Ia
MMRGPIPGEGPARNLGDLADVLVRSGIDGLLMSRGMLRAHGSHLGGRGAPALIVGLDWNNTFLDMPTVALPKEGRSELLGSVEDALILGADGVMTYLFLGWSDAEATARHMADNAAVSRECDRLGVVRIIEVMIRGREVSKQDQTNPSYIAMAARFAYEIGCDLVKLEWPGSSEALASVVEACPAPILVAGGDLVPSGEFLAMVQGALQAGARGFVVGRNIMQSSDRATLVQELMSAVHGVSPLH